MRRGRHRRSVGTSLAELPVNLWVFIFVLLMPFIDFVTLGYRACLAYFCVRDATTQAAFQSTYSTAASQAQSTLTGDSASWTGISFTTPTVSIIQVDSASGVASPPVVGPWSGTVPTVDASGNAYVYLIRVQTTGSLNPLISLAGTGPWGSVPGITAPLSLNYFYQVMAENTTGLNQ